MEEIAEVIVSNVDKKSRTGEQPVRLCNYTDVYKNDVVHSGMPFMEATATPAQMEKYGLHSGDIIITKDSEQSDDIAVPTFVEETAADLLCGYHLAIVRVGNSINGRYLKYCFESPQTRRYFSKRANGVTRFGLTLSSIEGAVFRIPRLQEQHKIADILRTWDEGVAKSEALRAAKLNHRNWLKQNLLTGRKRLSGFSREWRVVRLNEILTEHRLQSTGSEEVFSVSVHKGLVNQVEHLGRSYASTNTARYNRVLTGDIIYTKSPTGEFPYGIIKQSRICWEVIVSPLYGVFTPVTQELGVIIDAYFESPIMTRNFLHPLVQKGAKNTIAITNSRFLEGKLRLPLDLDEQKAIAVALETSKSELTGIDTEIKMLNYQKRGLMQKLLTGEWQVTV